jgi:hypothetical protein
VSVKKAAPPTPGSGVRARGNVSSIADRSPIVISASHLTQAPIRAELIGVHCCSALGITVCGSAPVLALCRELVAAGHDPSRPLDAYRDGVLALAVRTIGEGARLRNATHGVGFERLPACTARLPARQGGRTKR